MLLGQLPTPLLMHDATRAYAFATHAILAPGAPFFGLGKPIPPPLLMLHLPLLMGNRMGNRCKRYYVYEQSAPLYCI